MSFYKTIHLKRHNDLSCKVVHQMHHALCRNVVQQNKYKLINITLKTCSFTLSAVYIRLKISCYVHFMQITIKIVQAFNMCYDATLHDFQQDL